MIRGAKTSPFYDSWIERQPDDLAAARDAIDKRDFEQLAAVSEHNCLKMHSVMWASRPPVVYWNNATIACMETVRDLQNKSEPVFFTIDAGPQLKAVCPAMIVAGALGGMAWASIPAYLRTRFNTNEILVSLMLNYVAVLLLSYLVHGPWRDPEGFNFPESRIFADAALLPIILEDTRLHLGLPIALLALVLGWVFVRKSFIGYQMRVAGLADVAALYAGFNRKRMVWIGLLVGGGAAGIAGLSEVAGPIGQLLPSVSPGYGYAAIIVAFVGRLHPVGIGLASLLMSLLYLGGESAQMELGLPSAITGVFQGVLLFFLLAADLFITFRVRMVQRAPSVATEVGA